jgi:hypothetical protein
MAKINPFQNEEESIQIGDLTIENRLDRIELYGSLHITKDKSGLKLARLLKELIDSTLKALEQEKGLPDKIKSIPPDTTENPFK